MATEIELKLLFAGGAADLLRLQDLLLPHARSGQSGAGQIDSQTQVNWYLDTAQRELHSHRAMLRVRQTQRGTAAPTWRMTAKLKPSLAAGILSSTELERALEPAEVASWQDGPPPRLTLSQLDREHWLDHLLPADATLHVLGALRNQRQALTVPRALWQPGATDLVTLELDRTLYSAEVERCELELEHPDAAAMAPALQAWLTQQGLETYPATESKYAQFLRLQA
jgi:inorganic triphosphatase YgiF